MARGVANEDLFIPKDVRSVLFEIATWRVVQLSPRMSAFASPSLARS